MNKQWAIKTLLVLSLASPALADIPGTWTNYTNTDLIRNILLVSDTLWVASTGGLIRHDLTDNSRRVYTTRDGLGDLAVNSLVKDKSGRVWAATYYGLSYMVAGGWLTTQLDFGSGGRLITSLAMDSTGVLWAGSYSGVSRLQGETWTHYPPGDSEAEDTYISALAISPENELWAGGKGLYKMEGDSLEEITFNDGSTVRDVQAIAFDNDGNVWFMAGIYLYMYDGIDFAWYQPQGEAVTALARDSDGVIWIGTDHLHLYTFDGLEWVPQPGPEDVETASVTSILHCPDGRMFVGTAGAGYFYFDTEGWVQYMDLDGPPGVSIGKLYHYDSSVLVSIGEKFYLFDGSSWQDVTELRAWDIASLSWYTVESTGNECYGWNDDDGFTSGIVCWDGSELTELFAEADYPWVYSVTAIFDKEGNLWVSAIDKSDYGPQLFELRNGIWVRASDFGFPSRQRLISLAADSTSGVWVGTIGDGLYHYDGSNWRYFEIAAGTDQYGPLNIVTDVTVAADGDVWVATARSGVRHYDGESFVVHDTSNGFPSTSLHTIAVDNRGWVWVGTRGNGLLCYRRGEWEKFTSADGLVYDDVSSVLPMDDGSIWIGTWNGLSHFRPDVTGLDDNRPAGGAIPDQLYLANNYPNPFNTATNVAFSLPQETDVRLEVYDILGRRVRILIEKRLHPGDHRITWDGRDQDGRELPSGVYFLRLSAGGITATRKVVLLR